MKAHNHDIAKLLNQTSDLLEIDGAGSFRVRAYRNAARSLKDMSKEIATLIEEGGDVSQLPDIGESMAKKIQEIVTTGSLKQLEQLKKKIPINVDELTKVENLGASRIKLLFEKLKITSLKELHQAASEGTIEEVKGFGKKTQEKILNETTRLLKDKTRGRFRIDQVEKIATGYLTYIKELREVKQAVIAGSYRRRKETVGDIDLVAVCRNAEKVMDHFVAYDEVDHVNAKGETRSSVVLRSGLQVDLRVVPAKNFGAALLYFTGSKEHSIALRKICQEKDYKLNEYGVFKGSRYLAGETEEAVYKKMGLAYIEPELRESRGEIEAAKKNNLPTLITINDIKGDLHSHTTYSDGKNTLHEMADAAKAKGYRYFAVTDHTKRVAMAQMDEKKLAVQLEEIDAYNEGVKNFRILKSAEVDILIEGSLDLSNDMLKQLDIVVCSIHYDLKLSREKQTTRILKAMDNPYFNILGHPTGRLIGRREAYELDLEEIMKTARNNGCFLELNASPERLDLNDVYVRMAIDHGLKVSIATDSHAVLHLDNMRYGVDQARRGWLTKDDVINTRSWPDLKKLLKRS